MFDKIKKLVEQNLRQKITIDSFVSRTNLLCKQLSRLNTTSLSEQNVNLVKKLASLYLKVFSDNSLLIKYEDLDTLAAFSFYNFLVEKDKRTLIQVLCDIKDNSLNLRLADGDMDACQTILKRLNQLFDMQSSTNLEELTNYLKKYFIEMIGNKFLDTAYDFFTNKLKPKLAKHELDSLLQDTFWKVLISQDIAYLDKVVRKFEIDFKDYLIERTVNGQIVALSVTSAISCVTSKEQYLLFLKKYYVHPDSDQHSVHFKNKMLGMTALLNASNTGDLELVELLTKYGADINQLILYKNGDVVTFRTPFSVSFGTGDIEFVKSLVYKFGANPLQAILRLKQLISDLTNTILPSNLHIIPSIGACELLQKIGKEEYEKYGAAYFEIVENYFLEQALKDLSKTKKHSQKKERKRSSKKDKKAFLPAYCSLLTSEACEEPIEEPIIEQQLITDYLDLQGTVSQTFPSAQTLENKLDILLLEYIQVQSDENARNLCNFIKKNPEIELYSVTAIFNSLGGIEDVKSALMHDPRILHKFFQIKKANSDSLLNKTQASSVAETIPEGAYKVQSSLKNAAYVAVSAEVKQKLDPTLFTKFAQKLMDCSFIKANSTNESGIKIIRGTIKLKLATEDISIAAHVKYFHKPLSVILIVLDKIIDHSYKYPDSDLKTIEIASFSEVSSQLQEVTQRSRNLIGP